MPSRKRATPLNSEGYSRKHTQYRPKNLKSQTWKKQKQNGHAGPRKAHRHIGPYQSHISRPFRISGKQQGYLRIDKCPSEETSSGQAEVSQSRVATTFQHQPQNICATPTALRRKTLTKHKNTVSEPETPALLLEHPESRLSESGVASRNTLQFMTKNSTLSQPELFFVMILFFTISTSAIIFGILLEMYVNRMDLICKVASCSFCSITSSVPALLYHCEVISKVNMVNGFFMGTMFSVCAIDYAMCHDFTLHYECLSLVIWAELVGVKTSVKIATTPFCLLHFLLIRPMRILMRSDFASEELRSGKPVSVFSENRELLDMHFFSIKNDVQHWYVFYFFEHILVTCGFSIFIVFAVILIKWRLHECYEQLMKKRSQEREQLECKRKYSQRRFQRRADSMLNHTLKNIMGSADAEMELLSQKDMEASAISHIKRAQIQLQNGMRWCHMRHVFVGVEDGSYEPKFMDIDLWAWFLDIGRHYEVDVRSLNSKGADAKILQVSMDRDIVELIILDGLTSAKKFGSSPPWITVAFQEDEGMLCMRICNRANPDAPPLTSEQCNQFFIGLHRYEHRQGSDKRKGCTYDGVDLRNAAKAAALISGCMELRQRDGIVSLTLWCPLPQFQWRQAPVSQTTSALSPYNSAVPHRYGRHGPCRDSATSPASRRPLPSDIRCVSVDDSPAISMIYDKILFQKHLGVVKVFTLGSTPQQVDKAVDTIMAMGKRTIVLLDQNLDSYPNGELPRLYPTGTEIAAALHARNFKGLVGLRSGGTKEDLRVYAKVKGLHFVIGKASNMKVLAETIREAFWELADASG